MVVLHVLTLKVVTDVAKLQRQRLFGRASESFRHEDVLVLLLDQTNVSLVISLSSHILTLSVQSYHYRN